MKAESDPCACFPEIVGRADHAEAPSVRDLALCGAGLTEILQSDVSHQVKELKDAEQGSASVVNSRRGPRGRSVVWVQVEVHGEEAKETIVVEAVFEQVHQRHSLT